jgi:protein gp37
MNRTKIDWPGLDYTWNPQVGCSRGCPYCVVRQRVWPRIRHLYGNNDYDKVTFLPDQLFKPKEIKKPSKFFVDFYSDIEYSTRDNLQKTIDVCLKCERHTFMFLSKNTTSYYGFDWPANVMCGLTITGCQPGKDFTDVVLHKTKHRPFLSIEPLLGIIPKTDYSCFELVIVGAMTGKNAIVPQQDWIQSIKDNIPEEKIYWKKNIRGYLNEKT